MRNIQRIGMYALVVGLVMGPCVTSVMAVAMSDSTAQLSWPVSITGNINWTQKWSESWAAVDNGLISDTDDHTLPGWDQTTSASANVNLVSSYAETTTTRLFEEVSATRDGVTVDEAFADASGRRAGYFTAITSGYVTVTASFNISQTLSTQLPGEIAEGVSIASLYMLNNESEMFVDFASFENTVKDGQVFSDSASGTLSLEVWYNAGEVGHLMCEVSNIAYTVPEPSSLMVIGAGLGMALLRRRR